jgi:hypothetical protein
MAAAHRVQVCDLVPSAPSGFIPGAVVAAERRFDTDSWNPTFVWKKKSNFGSASS